MSATDTLGHRDVRVHIWSATDPCLRQRIRISKMPKDVGMLSLPVLVTTSHMSVGGDNTTPIMTVELDFAKWCRCEFMSQ